MRRRGIENILLRRVRRHQSMTALFRAPDAGPTRRPQAQVLPVIQKKDEQDLPVDVPMTGVKPSLPVSPVRPSTVIRQAAPPLASMPKPSAPLPSSTTEPEPT